MARGRKRKPGKRYACGKRTRQGFLSRIETNVGSLAMG